MPSEVVQKENKISTEVKEIVEKIDTKIASNENDSEERKPDNDVQVNDKSEKLNGSEKAKVDDEIQINDKSEKSNSSEETKVDGKTQIDDKLEKLNNAEELSESENKENEEPIVEDSEMLKKRAEELLVDGKRHLIIKDFQAAVDVLSEACGIFGSVYGEMAEECAEAYFKYGCALLELSKDQINPVGLEEKADEDVSIQDESVIEVNQSNDKKEATVSETTDKVEEKLTDNKEEEMMFVDKEKSTEKEETEETSVNEENSGEDENEELDEENIDEGDVNDLQLAWEMLDLAKVIYKNKDTEESKLRLAEVLMKCGEVSFEDEKFDTAIEDMTESLQIRRLLLPEDSRIIAETLFQLAIAKEMNGSGGEAIELLTEAAAVLEQRITNLENLIDDKAKEEVAEIKSIIPEIKEKMIDIKERKQAAICAMLAAVGASNKEATNDESSTNKQVSNIGHLVRKRPKQEETTGTIPNKVPKIEESTAAKQQ